jgi:Zinc knuckle
MNFGRYFGEATMLLERNQDYNEYAELPRMIYLEDEDCFIPAFFQGAPQICFHCRRAGHIRKECQELAKIQCYKCKGYGHMSRYCQNSRKETIVEEDMESYHKEAVKIPNLSPKKAVVQEKVTGKAVTSKAENESVENANMENGGSDTERRGN